MKLVVLLSIATLVACDHPTSTTDASDSFGAHDKRQGIAQTIAPIEHGNSFFKFGNFYRGAFPPARFPPSDFYSPLNTFNFASSPQGIIPPISQIIPPQISQVVPPIFGNTNPVLPPSLPVLPPSLPVLPPSLPVLPPSLPVSPPSLPKFSFPYYSALYQYPYSFPSFTSFPPSPFFPSPLQKHPPKTQQEPLSASYGPPVADPEPSGPSETSAPFEPAPVSFPYEPAVPEAPEPAAQHQPAQEYGLPPPLK